MKKTSTHHLPGGRQRAIIIRIGDTVQVLHSADDVDVIELPGEINPTLGPGAVADILHVSRPLARRLIAEGSLESTGGHENRAQTDLHAVIAYLLGNVPEI